MSKPTDNTETVTIDNIDDFLPMPGAEDIVTTDGNGDDKNQKPGFFKKEGQADLGFLDEEEEGDEGTPNADDVNQVISELDPALAGDDDDEDEPAKPGRKKVDKSGLVETFSKLIEEGSIVPFDDDKPLEDYSLNDWKELINANFEERERAIKEATPKEFFEALPEELRYAAEYVAKGGNDLKGLFKVLAQNEDTRSLDPAKPADQEVIVREYLSATMADEELVEEQIQEWIDAGIIGKKAGQLKPKLDAMNEQLIQQKLDQQEKAREKQIAMKQAYLDNIMETLKPGELNGVKIDNKRQKFLWDELTTTKYQSITGKPTNLLGKLLEDHQFGEKKRYDLIAEALWLLSDPDDYKAQISKQVKNEVTKETVRKLKTEESRKVGSSIKEEPEDKTPTRKIARPKNIFGRR
jgi:hypothetical protein